MNDIKIDTNNIIPDIIIKEEENKEENEEENEEEVCSICLNKIKDIEKISCSRCTNVNCIECFHKMELNQGCLACLRMVSRFCLMRLVFSSAILFASANGLPFRMGRLCPISVNQASRFARMRSRRNIIMRP